MSGPWDEFSPHRILVALDTSSHSLAALEAAAELAAYTGAELSGVFVEDANLIRVTGLSFACAISSYGIREEIRFETLERAFKVQADEARERLSLMAGRLEVSWSFRTARGEVVNTVLDTARNADLISVGKAGLSLIKTARPGSTALRLARLAPKGVLLVQYGVRFKQPMMLISDALPTTRRALIAAARLAEISRTPLTVLTALTALTAAVSPEQIRLFEEDAAHYLARKIQTVRFRRIQKREIQDLLRAIKEEQPGALIAGAESSLLTGDHLEILLSQTENPLFLFR